MPSSNSLLPLIKTAGAGFVGGLLIYGVGDVLGEYTTFFQLQDKAMILANRSQELKDQIGHPFTAGPWYNARIGFTAGGHLAQCTFQLQVGCNGCEMQLSSFSSSRCAGSRPVACRARNRSQTSPSVACVVLA